jgi:hypothetical protein
MEVGINRKACFADLIHSNTKGLQEPISSEERNTMKLRTIFKGRREASNKNDTPVLSDRQRSIPGFTFILRPLDQVMSMCKVLVALAAFIGLARSAAADDVACTPTEVAVYHNSSPRVHVKCSAAQTDGSSTIWYWAIQTTDPQWANRFISVATTALVSGRDLTIRYTPFDTSGAAWGCGSTDCRTALVITLR